MAFDYDNLIADLGSIVDGVNELDGWATGDLAVSQDAIATVLSGDGLTVVAGEVTTLYDKFKDYLNSCITSLTTSLDEILKDRTTVLTQLPGLSSSSSTSDVIKELIRYMVENGKTVDDSSVTLGGSTPHGKFTANGTNTGDYAIFATRRLCGAVAPGSGFLQTRYYAYDDVNDAWPGEVDWEPMLSEMAAPETIVVECTGANTVGSESWSLTGADRGNNPYDWRGTGTGKGPTLRTASNVGGLTDSGFEVWVTGELTNWDSYGTASGTTITAGAGIGGYSLDLTDTHGSTFGVTQALTGLTALRSYGVGLWAKVSSALTNGTVIVYLQGTGMERQTIITLNTGNLTTSWVPYFGVGTLPLEIPSDLELCIEGDGMDENLAVSVDGLVFGNLTYSGGIGYFALAGAIAPVVGDRYTLAIANNGAGELQEMFRKLYKAQLPSA